MDKWVKSGQPNPNVAKKILNKIFEIKVKFHNSFHKIDVLNFSFNTAVDKNQYNYEHFSYLIHRKICCSF